MERPCPPFDPNPRRPRLTMPPGACDSHFHIFGPRDRYPYVAERSYTPPEASIDACRHMQRTLGIARCVIIQPSVYGSDNACTLDAMRALGPNCRAVVVVPPTIAEDEIGRMHAAGVRGIRINVLFRGGVGLDTLMPLAERIAPFGWHVQLLIDGRMLPALIPRIKALPVPVVIDHLGHAPVTEGMGSPGVRALLDLVAGGHCWVKVSGAYRLTLEPAPYPSVRPLARALIAAAPNRLVWGTDWPHPAIEGPMPNDGDLLDVLADWTDDPAAQRKILVDNPAAFYGF